MQEIYKVHANQRIVIVGNSVGLRIRPPRHDGGERTYAEWLRREGWEVYNACRAAALINEGMRWFEEDVIGYSPDVVIIQFGVVEACLRRYPRWLANRRTKNYFFNSVINRDYIFNTPISRTEQLIYRVIMAVWGRIAKWSRFNWQWLSNEKFLECMQVMIELALKETGARILVMGINNCDERIQRHLPGSSENIAYLNRKLSSVVSQFPANRVCFVPINDVLKGFSYEQMIPDGIHFSAEAHRLVAERLINLIRAQ